MGKPIVYVDRSEILDGTREALESGMKELVEFVEANEPQLIFYGYFFDGTGNSMTVVAIHPDSASMELHMQVGGPGFRKVRDFIKLRTIDVYDEPSDKVLAAAREKAEMLGGGTVTVHTLQAGFARTR